MSIDQPYTPDFATRKEEIVYRLQGVEAAIESAVRMGDDQEWLEWLQRRHDDLQGQLAKEQVEPDETYLDLAEHLPPAVWKSSLPRTCSLTVACFSCHAEMHGEWEGESPYTLVCPSCGQSYTVEERIP